jgi:hypothetical protein
LILVLSVKLFALAPTTTRERVIARASAMERNFFIGFPPLNLPKPPFFNTFKRHTPQVYSEPLAALRIDLPLVAKKEKMATKNPQSIAPQGIHLVAISGVW